MSSLQKGKFLILSALVEKLSTERQFWSSTSLNHFKDLIEEAFSLTNSPSHSFAAKRFLESCTGHDLAQNHYVCTEMWLQPTLILLLHYKQRDLVSSLILQRLVHQIPQFAERLLEGLTSFVKDFASSSERYDENAKLDIHERVLWAKLTILKHLGVNRPISSGNVGMEEERDDRKTQGNDGNEENEAKEKEVYGIEGAITCASSEIRIQALESIFAPILSSSRRLNGVDVSYLRLVILLESDNPSRGSRKKEQAEEKGEDIFRWLFRTLPGWINTSSGTGLARKDFAVELISLILDVWLPSSSLAPDDRMLQLSAIEEHPKPILDELFTPQLLKSLSMCLLHMFDSIRQKASCIISRKRCHVSPLTS
eukprot:472492-Hanusia_phi.AAC.7